MKRMALSIAAAMACMAAGAAEPTLPNAAAAAEPSAHTPAAQASSGEVARAVFTSAVNDREPVDSILTLGTEESHVYCFTELRGFAGQHVTHRWEYEGEVMAEVGFDVEGWRWRVWSRKNLRPEWRGTWRVSVVDQSGQVVLQRELTYEPAAAWSRDAKLAASGTAP